MTRARRFNLLLILSLIFFSVSLPGYFGRFFFLFSTTQPPVGAGLYPRQIWEIADGRFAVCTYGANQGEITGYQIHWHYEFHAPRLDHHALDGFDAHSFLPLAHKGNVIYLFSFPLWCMILPSLIAPAWWLYQRYRRKSDALLRPQGFPITTEQRP